MRDGAARVATTSLTEAMTELQEEALPDLLEQVAPLAEPLPPLVPEELAGLQAGASPRSWGKRPHGDLFTTVSAPK